MSPYPDGCSGPPIEDYCDECGLSIHTCDCLLECQGCGEDNIECTCDDEQEDSDDHT